MHVIGGRWFSCSVQFHVFERHRLHRLITASITWDVEVRGSNSPSIAEEIPLIARLTLLANVSYN